MSPQIKQEVDHRDETAGGIGIIASCRVEASDSQETSGSGTPFSNEGTPEVPITHAGG